MMSCRYSAGAAARPTLTVRRLSRELKAAVPGHLWRPDAPPRLSVLHVAYAGLSDFLTTAPAHISRDRPRVAGRAIGLPGGEFSEDCPAGHSRPSFSSLRGLATSAAATQHPWAQARSNKTGDGRPTKTHVGYLVRRVKDAGAEKNWREMERAMEAALADPDVLPLRVYNIAMNAFTKSGRWFKTADMFDEMGRKGVRPDVISYSGVIQAYGKGGKWEKCVSLLAEMEEKGIGPDALSYSMVIKACGDNRQWKKALDLLAEMPAKGIIPTAISYNTAITACRDSGQWEESVDLLRQMSANGVTPDSISYNTAMRGCVECGQLETALDLFAEMRANGNTPDAGIYSLAATACFELSRRTQEVKRPPRLLE